jgi:hypothetical protein
MNETAESPENITVAELNPSAVGREALQEVMDVLQANTNELHLATKRLAQALNPEGEQ